MHLKATAPVQVDVLFRSFASVSQQFGIPASGKLELEIEGELHTFNRLERAVPYFNAYNTPVSTAKKYTCSTRNANCFLFFSNGEHIGEIRMRTELFVHLNFSLYRVIWEKICS